MHFNKKVLSRKMVELMHFIILEAHSSNGTPRISKQNIWLNGKCPRTMSKPFLVGTNVEIVLLGSNVNFSFQH